MLYKNEAVVGPTALWPLHVVLGIFVLRSLVQIKAGMEFLQGESISTVGQKIEMYRTLGWASSAGLFFYYLYSYTQSVGEVQGEMIGTILAVAAITLVWPIMVHRHATWILHNAQYEIRSEPMRPLKRAIDGGWTTLGYILLALGTLAAMTLVLRLTLGGQWAFDGDQERYSMIVLCATTLFAGWELIRMTERAVLATRIYAVSAIAISAWEIVEKNTAIMEGTGLIQATLILLIAQLALPILSLYVIHRPQVEEA